MSKISRRKFITTVGATAATAAVLHACSSSDQATTSAPDSESAASVAASGTVAPADTPEVTTAKLGFIALTDAAPLIVAKEKGMFAKYGMADVEVTKQASWGATRDNLVLGSSGGGD